MKKETNRMYAIIAAVVFALLCAFLLSVQVNAAPFESCVADYKETYNGETAWWYHNADGDIDTSVTTVAHNKNGWWYVKDGKVDFSYTGLADNKNGTWYLEKGKVRFDYTGFYSDANGDWYVEKSNVKLSKNEVIYGTVKGVTAWWNVKNGKVSYAVDVAHNSNGWWYIGADGKVDFSYTGLARNSKGLWYCKNGQVDFDYTGTYKLYQASNYGYDSSTKVQITKGKATEFTRVFVGDSRTDCLSWAGKSDDGFICKWGQSYDYFVKTEIPELEKLLKLMPNIKSVIINMGVNDIIQDRTCVATKAAAYSAKINALISKYPNVKFYFASVYHLDGAFYGEEDTTNTSLNPYIDNYNALMKKKCKATYIPLQEYITKNNISTVDALHVFDTEPLRNYIVSITG